MHSKKVLRYYCDHCGKGLWKKPKALEHEDKCYYNPKNRCCGSCEHFEWYCNYYDKFLVKNMSQVDTEMGENPDNYKLFGDYCGGWALKEKIMYVK